MPLCLTYTPSVAPHLDDILHPILQKHFGMKLKDSFRILCPDAEARRDVEAAILQRPLSQGVLIGKSILTLTDFWREILHHHPSPRAPASPFLQQRALQIAWLKLHQGPALDLVGQRRALFELDRLSKVAQLSPRYFKDKNPAWKEVQGSYHDLLVKKFNRVAPEVAAETAWNLLAERKIPELEHLKEVFFLGFPLPDPSLMSCVRSLLKAYPQTTLHLYLPSASTGIDKQGILEKAYGELDRLSEGRSASLPLALPNTRQIRYGSPVHESRDLYQNFLRQGKKMRILTPTRGATRELLLEWFRQDAPEEAPPPSLRPSGSFALFPLLEELKQTEDPTPVPYAKFWDSIIPVMQALRLQLAREREGYGLRYLDEIFQRLKEWAQVESLLPLSHSLKDWAEAALEECLNFDFPNAPLSLSSLPLDTLDHAGFARADTVCMAGLNEGTYPPAVLPFMMAQDFQDTLFTHEKTLAFLHNQYLARETTLMSYSEYGLNGRLTPPSILLSEDSSPLPPFPPSSLPLFSSEHHPFFEENCDRERQRRTKDHWNADNGLLAIPSVQAEIHRRIQARPLGVTYLDDYAKCPWRFYARWHLGLEEKRMVDLEVEPLKRGRWQHALLEAVYRQIRGDFFENQRFPSRAEVEKIFEIAVSQLTQQAQDQEGYRHLPRVVFHDQMKRLKSQVLGILHAEHRDWTEVKRRLLPRFLEWSFGKKGNPPFHFPLSGGLKIPLSGAVDRVDVSEDGGHFLVVDYKSSRTSDMSKEMREHRSFQLVLYHFAVEKTLMKGARGVGALYWDLKDQKKNQGMVRKELFANFHPKVSKGDSFLSEQDFAHLDRSLKLALEESLRKILAGDYSLNPPQCLGSFCEFADICRYEEKPR